MILRSQVYWSHGSWRWHCRGGNGEIISSGEGFTRRWSAIRACKRATPAGPIECFDRKGVLQRTINR
jgi:uncharacterized protein YegP (UPF0339 family)